MLSECVRRMPFEKYVYFGDNARAPSGNRPESESRKFAFEAFEKLSRFPLKAAVIACNTVTAEAADALRAVYPFPVIGVEPAIKPAAAHGGKVLVLATKATAESARFKGLCARCSGGAQITVFSPERLAGEIEKHIFSLDDIALDAHLPRALCDGVVLGCTHYVFLAKRIAAFYGCPTFDGNAGAAERLRGILSVLGKECDTDGCERDFLPKSGMADHSGQKTNKCSKKCEKTHKNQPIFIGSEKNKNKQVFLSIK